MTYPGDLEDELIDMIDDLKDELSECMLSLKESNEQYDDSLDEIENLNNIIIILTDKLEQAKLEIKVLKDELQEIRQMGLDHKYL